ncbi:MAG: hypothetical protein IKP00_07005 [Victivallales bacterium]|nr:hypothetical protein [Victivallales bacterium]
MIKIKSLQDALAKIPEPPKPAPQKEPTGKTAVISAHFGGYSEIRREATLRAIQGWDEQRIKPTEALFLEMVLPDQKPCFQQADFPSWMRYCRIYGKERNRNLFQKEALWNLGAKLTDAEKMLFIDADSQPVETTDYFSTIFNLCENGKCVHACFHLLHEGQHPQHSEFYSVFSEKNRLPAGAKTFPGFGYCLTRADYDNMDGFNPYAICGGGDATFICENLPSIKLGYYQAKRFQQGILRQGQPQLQPIAPYGITMRHNFHGFKEDRAYKWGREVVALFGLPTAYCHIDSAGLLAWNDPDFLLKEIVMEKSRMHTKEELIDLIMEKVKGKLDRLEGLQRLPNGTWVYDKKDGNIYD